MVKKLNFLRLKATLGMAIFLVLPASQAFSQDISTFKSEIARYQAQVDTMNKTVNTTKYTEEMTKIQGWLNEAQTRIANDDAAGLKNLTLKISVYIDYVNTAVKRDAAIDEAVAEEEKLKALRMEYGKIEAEVQQYEAEQDVLNQKLESLTKK